MNTVITHCRGEKKKEKRKKNKLMDLEKKMMIVLNTKSDQKKETYLETKKYLKNILLKFMKLIFIFISITSKQTNKKYKLMKIGVNILYLELMIILRNIS